MHNSIDLGQSIFLIFCTCSLCNADTIVHNHLMIYIQYVMRDEAIILFIYFYIRYFCPAITEKPLQLHVEHFVFRPAPELPILLAQCISTTNLQPSGVNRLKWLSLGHNNVIVVRFKLTITVAMNGALMQFTALPVLREIALRKLCAGI